MTKLAERLKELRIDKEVSQKKVAEEIGISQSVYCDYENGKVEPTASIIIKLANYFNVSTDYLLGKEN